MSAVLSNFALQNIPTILMLNVETIYKTFLDNGIDFFTGVPDSLLKNICAYITDNTSHSRHIIAANEGNAIGLAAGHYLATGSCALVYMQNSGLGNTVNPLLSLADSDVYSIPMMLMIGWRGEPGVHDEPQHVKQGKVTLSLLEAMGIPYEVLKDDEEEAKTQISTLATYAKMEKVPVAIVIRKNLFASYQLQTKVSNDNILSREEAMKIVVDHLHDTDMIVSTTGKLSRELFEYREALHQGHGRDFLTVGSMGHSSSIALGIALEKPERRIFCFDGDGAFIMHTGALGIVASMRPKNYVHVLFNNGAHESVGGQPTIGYAINCTAIAKASGYTDVMTARTEQEIIEAMAKIEQENGPVLLEIKVKIQSRDDLGRPTTTPIENKEAFMETLNKTI